jgi:hypothetical protein
VVDNFEKLSVVGSMIYWNGSFPMNVFLQFEILFFFFFFVNFVAYSFHSGASV